MSDHTRRALLGAAATGVATGLAGCFGLGPGFGGGCTSQYSLELRHVDDTGLREAALSEAPRDRADRWRMLLDTAASEGEATLSTIYGPPVRDGQLVEAGEAYHETTVTVTDTASVSARVLELEYEDGVTAPSGATVVEYADLPAVDRAAVDEMIGDEKGRAFGDSRSVSIGGFEYVYPEDSATGSRLVGDSPVWVRYEGSEVEIRVTGTRQTERETFRITLERVADTAEAFGAYVRENYVVGLDGLSEAERDLVRQTTESEFSECEPLSDEFQGVVDHIRSFPDDVRPDGNLLVAFEGEAYVVELGHAVV